MNITIFGGSSPTPGTPAYQEAFRLGQLLGRSGHTILTGGYIGTMEAVSRGASESGGLVIGVTCKEIENWRPIKANPWVQEERKFETLQERLKELIVACDAAIALPGGPGTLTEIALTWNWMVINVIPIKPLVLIGDGWRITMETMFKRLDGYFPQHQRNYVKFAKNVDEVLSHIG